MRIKDMAESVKDLFMFRPEQIHVTEGFNKRHHTPEYETGIKELMGSIRENGILEPVTIYVENDTPFLTNGHRRMDATMRLVAEGVTGLLVPCRVEAKGTNDADRALSMITRNSGIPFSPIETAEVCKVLIGFGWSNAKIAQKTGFSLTHVDNLLTLLSAPQEALDMVDQGKVAASTVTAVVKEHGAKATVEILKEASAVAAATGKDKATPKHVEQVRENRAAVAAAELAEPPERETSTEDEGGEITALVPKAPKVAPIDWDAVGPKLRKHIEEIFSASDPTAAIKKAATYYDKTFPVKMDDKAEDKAVSL